jgi:hypothetical protein
LGTLYLTIRVWEKCKLNKEDLPNLVRFVILNPQIETEKNWIYLHENIGSHPFDTPDEQRHNAVLPRELKDLQNDIEMILCDNAPTYTVAEVNERIVYWNALYDTLEGPNNLKELQVIDVHWTTVLHNILFTRESKDKEELFNKILNSGKVPVDTKTIQGHIPMTWCLIPSQFYYAEGIIINTKSCVRRLLNKKANPGILDNQGLSPAHYVMKVQHSLALELMLQKHQGSINLQRKATEEVESGPTFAHCGCNYYSCEIFQEWPVQIVLAADFLGMRENRRTQEAQWDLQEYSPENPLWFLIQIG